jgi:uncharacterized protein (TIGR03437 family)
VQETSYSMQPPRNKLCKYLVSTLAICLGLGAIFVSQLDSSKTDQRKSPSAPGMSNQSLERNEREPIKVSIEPTPWRVNGNTRNWGSRARLVNKEGQPSEAHESDLEKGGTEGQLADRFFYEQRAYPKQAIPPAARARAYDRMRQEETRLRKLSVNVSGSVRAMAAQSTWVALGPTPIEQGFTLNSVGQLAGRVTAIALDPGYGVNNQTVYLGGAQGGIWRSRDNGANWTPLTDDQPSLAIGALAVDPTNPNIIYVGTGEGNRSYDNYYGAGLLKSTNGGATWTQIGGPIASTPPQIPAFLFASFFSLKVDSEYPSTIYAATGLGVTSGSTGGTDLVTIGQRGAWKSTDGGTTWINLDPLGTGGAETCTDIEIDPLDHQRVFASLARQGIFRSNSGGAPGTWERLTTGLPDTGFSRVELAVGPPLAPSTNSTLYAVFAQSDGDLLGIFRSTDGGASWLQVALPQARGQDNYNLALVVDPLEANIVYYGTQANSNYTGGTLWRSKNGGASWSDISLGTGGVFLHEDTHVIVISPTDRNTLFTGNDGGIWRTNNATATTVSWNNLNRTLSLTQIQALAIHPTDPSILIGGTQDNGTNLYSGAFWRQLRAGDGGSPVIDSANPQVIYHTFENYNNTFGIPPQLGPEVSSDGGNSWAPRGCFGCVPQFGGLNPSDRVGFYAPLSSHTGFTGPQGNVIYFGTHRVYRSANRGSTWIGLGASADGFGTDLSKGDGWVSVIRAHPIIGPGSPPAELVWIGTSDGNVQFTANAGAIQGAMFTNVTKPPLPNRFVTDIAIDPSNQQTVFVTYSGFDTNTPPTPGHVFTSNDQGATWINISGNLPDLPVASIVIDPVLPQTFYIGTDLGVFQTSDGGSTWFRLSNGMPLIAVFMLRYNPLDRTLVAGTHGRGTYRLALPNSLPNAISSFSVASRTGVEVAIESLVISIGSDLATTAQGEQSHTNSLPTSLAGTTIKIRDSAGSERFAQMVYARTDQVQYQIPPGTNPGLATVAITSGDGTISVGTLNVVAVAPGLFSADSSGTSLAVAQVMRLAGGAYTGEQSTIHYDQAHGTFVTTPIDLGPETQQVVLVVYGTGIRFSPQSGLSVTIGGVAAPIDHVGLQPNFPGLDQVSVTLPRSLIGRGEVDVVLVADGKTANVVKIAIL